MHESLPTVQTTCQQQQQRLPSAADACVHVQTRVS